MTATFPRYTKMIFHKKAALKVCLAMGLAAWAAVCALANGERAVVINNQRLYRDPRVESKTVGRIAVGEEAVITEREGLLLQVTLADRVGWTLANGLVVLDSNPRAAGLLFDAAENTALEDSIEAWLGAARLFRKAAALADKGPYAPEALWRAAELSWRAAVRGGGDQAGAAIGTELEALVQAYPKTAVASRAAFLLLRNNLCADWDGAPGCPESEIGPIAQYLEEYPDSPRAGEARHALAYRHAALVEIYLQQDKPHFSAEKAVAHKDKAREAVEALLRHSEGTAWAARGERLLWSLENNVGVFSGIEVALRRQ